MGVLALLIVVLIVLEVAGQALSDAVYSGTNQSLTYGAGNYLAAVAFLILAVVTARHDRRRRSPAGPSAAERRLPRHH